MHATERQCRAQGVKFDLAQNYVTEDVRRIRTVQVGANGDWFGSGRPSAGGGTTPWIAVRAVSSPYWGVMSARPAETADPDSVDVPREFHRRMAAIIEAVQTGMWQKGVHDLLGYATDYAFGDTRGPADAGSEEPAPVGVRAPAVGDHHGRERCRSPAGGPGHQQRHRRVDLAPLARRRPALRRSTP